MLSAHHNHVEFEKERYVISKWRGRGRRCFLWLPAAHSVRLVTKARKKKGIEGIGKSQREGRNTHVERRSTTAMRIKNRLPVTLGNRKWQEPKHVAEKLNFYPVRPNWWVRRTKFGYDPEAGVSESQLTHLTYRPEHYEHMVRGLACFSNRTNHWKSRSGDTVLWSTAPQRSVRRSSR